MEYKIKFTKKCLIDIDNACFYISNTLKSQQASIKLREKIKKSVINLPNNPKMYSQIDKFDKLNRIYRKIVINNYVLLYTIDEENELIYFSHMYYGGRNYLEILDN